MGGSALSRAHSRRSSATRVRSAVSDGSTKRRTCSACRRERAARRAEALSTGRRWTADARRRVRRRRRRRVRRGARAGRRHAGRDDDASACRAALPSRCARCVGSQRSTAASRRRRNGVAASSRQPRGVVAAASRCRCGGVAESSRRRHGGVAAASRQRQGVVAASRQRRSNAAAASRQRRGGVTATSRRRRGNIAASSRWRRGDVAESSRQRRGNVAAASQHRDDVVTAPERMAVRRRGHGHERSKARSTQAPRATSCCPRRSAARWRSGRSCRWRAPTEWHRCPAVSLRDGTSSPTLQK